MNQNKNGGLRMPEGLGEMAAFCFVAVMAYWGFASTFAYSAEYFGYGDYLLSNPRFLVLFAAIAIVPSIAFGYLLVIAEPSQKEDISEDG